MHFAVGIAGMVLLSCSVPEMQIAENTVSLLLSIHHAGEEVVEPEPCSQQEDLSSHDPFEAEVAICGQGEKPHLT